VIKTQFRFLIHALVVVNLTLLSAANANDSVESLPNPLALVDALKYASANHPNLLSLEAGQNRKKAELLSASSPQSLSSYIELEFRQSDKTATPGTEFLDDSRAIFVIQKLLTDFGRSQARIAAAQLEFEGNELIRNYKVQRHQIKIVESFLDVHLSDLRYNVDDEYMTLAFFPFSRTRDRREKFQEFPEVKERQLEVEYRRRFVDRTRSGTQQRLLRNKLALAMGRPGELASDIVTPDIDGFKRHLPEYDELMLQVLDNHPLMQSAKLVLQAAKQSVKSVKLAARPTLSARFEASEYERNIGSGRDRFRASLEMVFPITGGTSSAAALVLAEADLLDAKASLRQLEYMFRQQVLELVQELAVVQTELKAASTEEAYRDLYLDRSRTLYELEVRADLGDSQAKLADAVWQVATYEYKQVRLWLRLDLMRGLPLSISENTNAGVIN
jgi:outer membrane protein TolC